jgi:hypothetical protein
MPGLEGTLQGQQVVDPRAAMAQQESDMLAALMQQAAQAQQGAGEAAGQYQQAAQAPVEQVSGTAAFLPTLLSNVASIMGQNPEYAKGNREQLSQKNEALLEKRKTNLQALRDRYSTLAEHADKLGNIEAEAKWRTKAASIDREHDRLMQTEREAGDTKRLKMSVDAGKFEKESPAEKLKREQVDNWRALVNPFTLAGNNPPKILIDQGIRLGALPEGTTPEMFMGGARKPTALEIKNELIRGGAPKNVVVLSDDKWFAQRAIREKGAAAKKGTDRKSWRESMRHFDLTARRTGESPEAFVGRMLETKDPLSPNKPLFSREEIGAARDRLYTADELAE